MARRADCHPRRKHYARGLCIPCYQILHRYGIDREQYVAMLEAQQHRCPICLALLTKDIHVDHCHETGRVRGLVHGGCNLALGHLKDDPARCRRAAAYLEGDSTCG